MVDKTIVRFVSFYMVSFRLLSACGTYIRRIILLASRHHGPQPAKRRLPTLSRSFAGLGGYEKIACHPSLGRAFRLREKMSCQVTSPTIVLAAWQQCNKKLMYLQSFALTLLLFSGWK